MLLFLLPLLLQQLLLLLEHVEQHLCTRGVGDVSGCNHHAFAAGGTACEGLEDAQLCVANKKNEREHYVCMFVCFVLKETNGLQTSTAVRQDQKGMSHLDTGIGKHHPHSPSQSCGATRTTRWL